jgi:hypothetical protein
MLTRPATVQHANAKTLHAKRIQETGDGRQKIAECGLRIADLENTDARLDGGAGLSWIDPERSYQQRLRPERPFDEAQGRRELVERRGAKAPSERVWGCPPPLVAGLLATSYGEVSP